MRWIACLPLLFAACGNHQLTVPDALRSCPPRPAVPAPLPKVRTLDQVSEFAVRIELAREAERDRGDACAGVVAQLNRLIEGQK